MRGFCWIRKEIPNKQVILSQLYFFVEGSGVEELAAFEDGDLEWHGVHKYFSEVKKVNIIKLTHFSQKYFLFI